MREGATSAPSPSANPVGVRRGTYLIGPTEADENRRLVPRGRSGGTPGVRSELSAWGSQWNMLTTGERPRELKWYHAGPILFGDWGTSRLYVLGLAFAFTGHASFWFVVAMCVLMIGVGISYVTVCRLFPDGGGVYSAAKQRSQLLAEGIHDQITSTRRAPEPWPSRGVCTIPTNTPPARCHSW